MDQKPRIIHLPETESTNPALRQLANACGLTDMSVLWTDFQTGGRGQAGRSWESERGMNLLCSILFHPPHLPANQSFAIVELASLSVKRTLEQYVSGISIKWPNDIYLRHRKISGILIENDVSEGNVSRSIIGIGINLNQTGFKSDAPNPVSLAMATGIACDREEILGRLHASVKLLAVELEEAGTDSLHRKYCAALYRRDGFHSYRDASGCFEARIHAVEPSGHLILERRNGPLSRYGFQEIQSNP